MTVKLPAIPAISPVKDQTVATILRPMKESIELLGAAVTGDSLANPNSSVPSSWGSGSGAYINPDTVFFYDFTPPPTPQNLSIGGAFQNIILTWDPAVYGNHAYTEVWRATTNVLGAASLLGFAPGSVYVDAAGVGKTYYYWIRFRSTSDVTGPYNAVSGTLGSTSLVGSSDLSDAVITAQKIASGAINLSSAQVSGLLPNTNLATLADQNLFAAQVINSTALAPNSVVAGKIAANAIVANDGVIANAAIGSAQIQDAAIVSAKIGTAAVGSAAIQDAAITNAKIANLAVDSAKIADLAVGTAKIIDTSITTAKIADASITNAKIGLAAIATANIQNAAITNAKIQDAAITTAKIDSAAITTAKIADAAITNAKIGFAAVSSANIENAAITNAKIGNAEVDTLKLAGDSVTIHESNSYLAYGATNSATIVVSMAYPGTVTILVFCETNGASIPDNYTANWYLKQSGTTLDSSVGAGGVIAVRANLRAVVSVSSGFTFFTAESTHTNYTPIGGGIAGNYRVLVLKRYR